ncbi:MAG: transporter substrate-binding domain-containing protein [Clostridia bacterium]|nr:transporter substrate-binding domain-containing protein [Clostridia bacterium]
MKTLKKLTALLLALMMLVSAFALVSCSETQPGGNDDGETSGNTDDTANTDSDVDYIKNKGKLVVGVTIYEPMNYKDDNDEWTGFDTEFALAVAEKMGVDCEFVVIDWDNKSFELESKSIDLVWNGMTLSDKVKASMDCSDPYVLNAQVVVVDAAKAADYKDIASVKELKFAVEAGSAGEQCAVDNGFDHTSLTAQSDALLEVSSGAADACIIDITMANAMTGEGTSYEDLGIAFSLNEEEYGIGCRKGSDMVEALNGYIKSMKEDGTLTALATKYNLTLAD